MKNTAGFGCKNANRAGNEFLISVKDDLSLIQQREQIITEVKLHVWPNFCKNSYSLILNNMGHCLSKSFPLMFCSPLSPCPQCSGALSSLM